MSGARAELGIGAAWYEREHQFFGIPFPPLGERFDRLGEQLEVITGLWRTTPGDRFSYHGKHYQLEECASIPRPAPHPPPLPPSIPIIIGGSGPRRTPALAAVRRRVQQRHVRRAGRAVRQLQAGLRGGGA